MTSLVFFFSFLIILLVRRLGFEPRTTELRVRASDH